MERKEKALGMTPVDINPKSGKLASPKVATPLLAWLLVALEPMSRTRVKQLLQHGKIKVNGVGVRQFDHIVQPGDCITLDQNKATPPGISRAGVSILFLDDDLLVIEKPAGLLSVATAAERTRTAFALLLDYMSSRGMGRPFVVHRLDRETSGLLLFARSARVRDLLQSRWRGVTKTYLAIVEGLPEPAKGTLKSYLTEERDLKVRTASAGPDAKMAVTHYQVIGGRGKYSLVELELETGRKHQLRVHMSRLGCPMIGDGFYGATTNPANRLGLHAWKLEFDHPTTGAKLRVESPLPQVLERVVR
jgi:23S rRNA pseudouridine1911/1915/1917 synthase